VFQVHEGLDDQALTVVDVVPWMSLNRYSSDPPPLLATTLKEAEEPEFCEEGGVAVNEEMVTDETGGELIV